MPTELLLVLVVAAAFFLLGIAASPLAWVVMVHRRSRLETLMERRHHEMLIRLEALERRLNEFETTAGAQRHRHGRSIVGKSSRFDAATMAKGLAKSTRRRMTEPREMHTSEQPLITIPTLESAPADRSNHSSLLEERYGAIWTLADEGATLEQMARATGQPIGQVELILGLRRQIDAKTTPISGRHDG